VARLSDRDHIAAHAGLAVDALHPQLTALVSRAGAASAAHLVALAHAWNLPGFHTPAAPTAAATRSREVTR
jgi:hypothetical protein